MAIERYEKAEAYTRLYRTPMMELFRETLTSLWMFDRIINTPLPIYYFAKYPGCLIEL